jgi:hypothetical protein
MDDCRWHVIFGNDLCKLVLHAVCQLIHAVMSTNIVHVELQVTIGYLCDKQQRGPVRTLEPRQRKLSAIKHVELNRFRHSTRLGEHLNDFFVCHVCLDFVKVVFAVKCERQSTSCGRS